MTHISFVRVAALLGLLIPMYANADIDVVHDTAAGALKCAKSLCRTVPTAKDDGPTQSTHFIKLTRDAKEKHFFCDEGPSGDPTCTVDGKTISGEVFNVLGDGCLYVNQTLNSYFNVNKKYCAKSGGKLQRIHQPMYHVGVKAVADKSIQLYQDKSQKSVTATIKKGEPYEILMAEVDESDDFYTSAPWYLLKDKSNIVGWAKQDLIAKVQCTDTKNEGICFNGD